MATKYRYRPRTNRTPVNHPLFGHLEWDTIVENPEAAHDPDFEEIRPAKPAVPSKPAAGHAPADDPVHTRPDAGKPGRSK